MTEETVFSILFVCMGNICRSPTGEGIFKHYVAENGTSAYFHIESAGTHAYHVGEPADARMQSAALSSGYHLDSTAQAVLAADFDRFDLIIAMDQENYTNLQRLNHAEPDKLAMLGRFLPGIESDAKAPSVPDPYYGGDEGFEQVINMIEAACPRLHEYCLAQRAAFNR